MPTLNLLSGGIKPAYSSVLISFWRTGRVTEGIGILIAWHLNQVLKVGYKWNKLRRYSFLAQSTCFLEIKNQIGGLRFRNANLGVMHLSLGWSEFVTDRGTLGPSCWELATVLWCFDTFGGHEGRTPDATSIVGRSLCDCVKENSEKGESRQAIVNRLQ